MQRLARGESARRSTGGRNGIVWCHVKGHAGHPGNEWADVLADLGADCVFDAGGGGDVAYPFAQDDYEESDAADTRNATLPHLERLITTQMRPDGETRFKATAFAGVARAGGLTCVWRLPRGARRQHGPSTSGPDWRQRLTAGEAACIRVALKKSVSWRLTGVSWSCATDR